jgi:hypothetical protein
MVDRDNKMLNTIVGLVPLSLRDEKFRLLNQRLFKSACAQLATAYRRFMGEQVTDAQIDDIVRITDCFACGMSIHQAIFKDRELYTRLWRTICQLMVAELGGEQSP